MRSRKAVMLVFYDLPVENTEQRRAYTDFRKYLLEHGYQALQRSVYVKLLTNISASPQEYLNLKTCLPKEGTIHMLALNLNEFKTLITVLGEPFDMAKFSDDILWL